MSAVDVLLFHHGTLGPTATLTTDPGTAISLYRRAVSYYYVIVVGSCI